jgi:hypothetical protein
LRTQRDLAGLFWGDRQLGRGSIQTHAGMLAGGSDISALVSGMQQRSMRRLGRSGVAGPGLPV